MAVYLYSIIYVSEVRRSDFRNELTTATRVYHGNADSLKCSMSASSYGLSEAMEACPMSSLTIFPDILRAIKSDAKACLKR